MAEKGLVAKDALTAIADAIRSKRGTTGSMLPGEMAGLIADISGTLIIKRGTFIVARPSGYEKPKSVNLGTSIDVSGDYFLWLFVSDRNHNYYSGNNNIKEIEIHKLNGIETIETSYVDNDTPYNSYDTTTLANYSISPNGEITSVNGYCFHDSDEFEWAFVGLG